MGVKEHGQGIRRADLNEQEADDLINAGRLRADQHTGQQGLFIPGTEQRLTYASEIKDVYDLLPDFHKDELRGLRVVSPGTRLNLGDVFVDLRDRRRGELVAHGEETVSEELLVPKNLTDYILWNKLLSPTS